MIKLKTYHTKDKTKKLILKENNKPFIIQSKSEQKYQMHMIMLVHKNRRPSKNKTKDKSH